MSTPLVSLPIDSATVANGVMEQPGQKMLQEATNRVDKIIFLQMKCSVGDMTDVSDPFWCS